MNLVYLSSEVCQSDDYFLWILKFKMNWWSDFPGWKVTFILHGARRHWKHTHLLSWWMSSHSQDSKPILLGYRWQLKMHCMPITAGAQIPPSRKALLLSHHVPFCTWSYFCLHQKNSTVEWKRQKIFWHLTQQNRFVVMGFRNTCQPRCWSLCQCESQVSAYSIDNLQGDLVNPGLTQRQALQGKKVQTTGLNSSWKASEKPKVCVLTISPAWCLHSVM